MSSSYKSKYSMSEVESILDAAVQCRTLLGAKANKSDVPTKVSELENDSGYLTEHQSLEEYVTKEVLAEKADKSEIPTKLNDLEVEWTKLYSSAKEGYVQALLENETFSEEVSALSDGFYYINDTSSAGGGDQVVTPPTIPETDFGDVDFTVGTLNEDEGISTQTIIYSCNVFLIKYTFGYYTYQYLQEENTDKIYLRINKGSWERINTTETELTSEVAKINENINTQIYSMAQTISDLQKTVETLTNKVAELEAVKYVVVG